ncbi:MAG: hypothetical protein WA971_02095 [Microbacterium sp.]
MEVRTPPPLENKGWFLGSALQAYDLDAVDAPKGEGGFVDTIWTRHLRVSPPNLYWEIHHELFHVMWTSPRTALGQISSLVDELSTSLGIPPDDWLLFTDSEAMSRSLGAVRTLPGSVPFAIADEPVGRYSKLFVRDERGAFPAVDLVEFTWGGRPFTEVHVNLAHLAVAARRIPTIYSMPSKRAALERWGIPESPAALMSSWRTLRAVAVIDAIRHASAAGVTLSATKAGHTLKQLSKFLAYDLIGTRRAEEVAHLGLPSGIVDFLLAEIDRTRRLDVDRLAAMDPDFRRSTLGISDDQLRVAGASTSDAAVEPLDAGARYFTDLPLLGPLDDDQLATEFRRVALRRSGARPTT